MRILIAPDSFKNALPNTAVAAALAEGWRSIRPDDEVRCFPLSDGGEGFCATLKAANPAWREIVLPAHDALMRPIETRALVSEDGAFGALELAATAGLELINRNELRPMEATTYGTGEVLRQLIERDCRHIWMGIGGSATTDGGAGALMALGAKLYDGSGSLLTVPCGGGTLPLVARIDLTCIHNLLHSKELEVACDVTNPLCGAKGAAAVFSPQKGASPEQVARLDAALHHWASLFGSDGAFAGAGAAGGMGFMMAQIGARLRPGAEVLIGASGLEAALHEGADLVITGEGKSDRQTLDGKLCATVARTARAAGVPAALLSGAIPQEDRDILGTLFSQLDAISKDEPDLEAALAHTAANLRRAAASLAARPDWNAN